MSRCSLVLAGLAVAAAFQAPPASQPRFLVRQSSSAHSDLQVVMSAEDEARRAWLAKQGQPNPPAAYSTPVPPDSAAYVPSPSPAAAEEEATRDISDDIFDREPPRQPRDLETITGSPARPAGPGSAGLSPVEAYMQQVAQIRASEPAPAPPARSPVAYSEAAASDGAVMYGGASPYGYGGAVDPLTGARALRSAPSILFGALENLGKNPFGWLFGPPSPLYSNLPRAAPRATYPAAGQRRTARAPGAAPQRSGGPPQQQEGSREKSYLRDPTSWSSGQ